MAEATPPVARSILTVSVVGYLLQRYVGSFDYMYMENVTIGSGGANYEQTSWRTGAASIPMVLDLQYVHVIGLFQHTPTVNHCHGNAGRGSL
jgi:hypothetical protein